VDQSGPKVVAHFAVMDWTYVSSAPFDRDLELAVIYATGTHTLVFPCRRILGGWINAVTKRRVEVAPTHWREWEKLPFATA
jgi:hypothetical protein